MKGAYLTMKKPGEKGKCLTCKYFRCESGTAWCFAKSMREIYTSHVTEEERSSIDSKAAETVLRAKKKAETMEKLLAKVNPGWCVYR